MSEKRKSDHIDLAMEASAKVKSTLKDTYYEPLLSAHPTQALKYPFLNYEFSLPLWISSMTGGAQKAEHINKNLAKACDEFNIPLALGSCRPLLANQARLKDFDVKQMMPNAPLFSNFGVAQLEELIQNSQLSRVKAINKQLQVDGMVIHVNPLQEWAQPEGDRFSSAPMDTIKTICNELETPIIVKEVGQGMGPKSLALLSTLPIAAIELAGYGGTNFTVLEHSRRKGGISGKKSAREYFGTIGHTCEEMITWLNEMPGKKPEIIISGGMRDPILAHQLMLSYQGRSIVGMAREVLKHAQEDYGQLQSYLNELRECFLMAHTFIKGKEWK